MKKIATVLSLAIIGVLLFGQARSINASAIYVIFTSDPDSLAKEGITRGVVPINFMDNFGHPDVMLNPGIVFMFESNHRAFWMAYVHTEFDSVAISAIRPFDPSDNQEIIVKPIDFLNTVELIDMDVRLPKMSRQDAWAFHKSLDGKKVYFIDRNDITDSTVTLIEVKTGSTNKPTNDAIYDIGKEQPSHRCDVCFSEFLPSDETVRESTPCPHCAAPPRYIVPMH